MWFMDLLGLFYWAIMGGGGTWRGARLSATHALCLQGILLCKKLTNKHSGNVVFRLVGLITL